MTSLPLMLMLCVASVGYGIRRARPSVAIRGVQKRLVIIAYFAIGILVAWLLVSWLRVLVLAPFGATWTLTDMILAPVSLFYVESWVLLGAAVMECCYLKGRYDVERECQSTRMAGVRTAAAYTTMTTLAAFPIWWLIRPGEYGIFEGTLFHALVSDRTSAVFSSINLGESLSAQNLSWMQNLKAIPDALVIAALLTALVPLIHPTYRYFKMVMDDEYLHLPPKEEKSDAQADFPTPRGKRVIE